MRAASAYSAAAEGLFRFRHQSLGFGDRRQPLDFRSNLAVQALGFAVGIVEDQDRPHLFLGGVEITLLPKVFRFHQQVANETLLQSRGRWEEYHPAFHPATGSARRCSSSGLC